MSGLKKFNLGKRQSKLSLNSMIASAYGSSAEADFFSATVGASSNKYDLLKSKISSLIDGKTASVIDIGGGSGAISIWLSSNGSNVVLIDLSDECLNFAKNTAQSLNLDIDFLNGDVTKIDIGNLHKSFDLAICFGATHNCNTIEDVEALIERCRFLIRDSGAIIISFLNIKYLIRLLISNALLDDISTNLAISKITQDEHYCLLKKSQLPNWFCSEALAIKMLSRFDLVVYDRFGFDASLDGLKDKLIAKDRISILHDNNLFFDVCSMMIFCCRPNHKKY
jgi:2-polyprenyl-3-methyl-5-hydroxy-6-metoxy-1,4-benzoquinol methylase